METRHHAWPVRRAAVAASLLVAIAGTFTGSISGQQQYPLPPVLGDVCSAPPDPAADTWPIAVTDLLGRTAGPFTFTAADLTANDTAAAPAAASFPAESTPTGGTLTGTGPFVYTPTPGFVGTDAFTYELSDGNGRKSIGLVKVTVVTDTTPPTVAISSPAAGSVAGTINVAATAADNVRLAGVRFLDNGAQIGIEDTTAPYSVAWDTTLTSEGSHTLTAIARDSAGLSRTSAPVVVTVANGLPPATDGMAASTGKNKRSAPLTTTKPGDLIVAFAAWDGPATGTQSSTVAGGGLNWTLVKRAATVTGVAEIWSAPATKVLAKASITSTPAVTGLRGSLVVVAFRNAAGVGASIADGAATGAASVSLVTQTASSLVYGVGVDPDRALARTVGSGQTKVNEVVDRTAVATFWVQALSAPAGGVGTTATINDTAPATGRWNLAAVEIKSLIR